MTTPATTTFVYDGPIETVTVPLPSGRAITVSRGDSVDALPSEVDALARAEGFTQKTAAAKPADQPKPSDEAKENQK